MSTKQPPAYAGTRCRALICGATCHQNISFVVTPVSSPQLPPISRTMTRPYIPPNGTATCSFTIVCRAQIFTPTHAQQNGQGKCRHAAKPGDLHVRVPPGTVLRDQEGVLCGEVTHNGEELIVARGGRGGRGNLAFKTDRNNAPKVGHVCNSSSAAAAMRLAACSMLSMHARCAMACQSWSVSKARMPRISSPRDRPRLLLHRGASCIQCVKFAGRTRVVAVSVQSCTLLVVCSIHHPTVEVYDWYAVPAAAICALRSAHVLQHQTTAIA